MKPIGKARPRVTTHGAYTPGRTKAAEDTIAKYWMQFGGAACFVGEPPLKMLVEAFFVRPKGTKRIFPTVKPDADNILKLVEDALNGLAYLDDKQLVDVRCTKRYANMECLKITVTDEVLA